MVPDFDLFGGDYRLPPEMRLLERFSLRLSPSQKERFFQYASGKDKTPSGVLRDYVLSLVGDY
jgi:hypothetical protein